MPVKVSALKVLLLLYILKLPPEYPIYTFPWIHINIQFFFLEKSIRNNRFVCYEIKKPDRESLFLNYVKSTMKKVFHKISDDST